MRYTLLVAALAASTFAASPAFAQAVASAHDDATARGTVLGAYSFKKDVDLDFGVVAVDPVNAGTVSLDASSTPNRTPTGGVTLLASPTVSAARFLGYGAPNENVSIAVTTPSGAQVNDGSGHSIPMSLTLGLASNPAVTSENINADGSGAFTVYVGGTFTIAGGQTPGVYSNTFRVTATYQ